MNINSIQSPVCTLSTQYLCVLSQKMSNSHNDIRHLAYPSAQLAMEASQVASSLGPHIQTPHHY